MESVADIIVQYGGDRESTLLLDDESPELLPYATLTAARSHGHSDLSALMAIYEWQGRPLLVVVDGTGGDQQRLHRIRRVVAMRGDAPYLAVVTGGTMAIYPIGLDKERGLPDPIDLSVCKPVPSTTIPYLANLRPLPEGSSRWISDIVLKLLSGSIDRLLKLGVKADDAISLVGRALFVRFLADRGLMPARPRLADGLPQGDLFQVGRSTESQHFENLFDSAPSTVETSLWLDATFNGDFLPLSISAIHKLPEKAFFFLGDILRKSPDSQPFLGWAEKWDRLDFAHIPVGVLSQAYERYLHRHEAKKQKKEGGYYTPRHIADLMVTGAFHALRQAGVAHTAKVLDPSAGAGIFLITAFRQLVMERWRHDDVRPDTKTLRQILFEQITGFDVNEAALRFAALGLYLISIELDPNPEPVEKLAFGKFRDRVLLKLGKAQIGEISRDLGSLGPEVGRRHRQAYDLVIGNPPWATATQLPGWSAVQNDVARIASSRQQGIAIAPPLPNEVLDLPFLWKAMDWAKPNAQIAFALHARLLFQQGETMPAAREAIFRTLDVISIINGSELRSTRVWPEITAPFCLLFAQNAVPGPASTFRFVTPRFEPLLNKGGAWRVDAIGADQVSTLAVADRAEHLKVLYRGTVLDLDVLDRVAAKNLPSLRLFWGNTFGLFRGRPKNTGNGYQKLRPSSRVRKAKPGSNSIVLPGSPAGYLHGLPEVNREATKGVLLDKAACHLFEAERIHDPRSIDIFGGPLLIVAEVPRVAKDRITTTVSPDDAVYNQSYHGYSTTQHEDGLRLTKYLALVMSSRFALWYALMTSGRFGFERDVVEKFVLDDVPMVPFDALSDEQREQAANYFDDLAIHETDQAWQRVDDWICTLYGLNPTDQQTINDTLSYGLPFAKNLRAAHERPERPQVEAFHAVLVRELEPWAKRFGGQVTITEAPIKGKLAWRFLRIAFHDGQGRLPQVPANPSWTHALSVANGLALTQVIYFDEEARCIYLGRLDQKRHWSKTQARLAARGLVWDHIDTIAGLIA